MTQNGVVTRLLDGNMAEVSVQRGTACGGSCSGGCEACQYASRILILAHNSVFARPGERVVISARTGGVMGATLLVYMLPLVFFFAGYALAAAAGLGQGGAIAVSMVALVLGAAVTVFIGRRRKSVRFDITGYER